MPPQCALDSEYGELPGGGADVGIKDNLSMEVALEAGLGWVASLESANPGALRSWPS